MKFSLNEKQRGNVVTILLGSIAAVGVVSVTVMSTLTGPLRTSAVVNARNVAEAQANMAARIMVLDAVNVSGGADSDSDGIVEPREYKTNGSGISGGGDIPDAVGASKTDPWGTLYGYCVWDHGTTDAGKNDGGTGTDNRLNGEETPVSEPVIAIISAGQDRTFQTSCAAYDASGDEGVVTASGADDLIFSYTYAEAVASGNSLWILNSSDTNIIEVQDSGGTPTVQVDTSTGTGDFLVLKTNVMLPHSGTTLDIRDADNDSVFLISNNNVGAPQGLAVGTTATAFDFEVTDTSGSNRVSFNSDTAQVDFFIEGAAGARNGIIFKETGEGQFYLQHDGPTNKLVFHEQYGTSTLSALTLDSNGNFSIGGTSQGSDPDLKIFRGKPVKLQLQSSTDDTTLEIKSPTDDNSIIILKENGASDYTLQHTGASDRFDILANAVTALSIDTDGDIGIHNTSPTVELDVDGDIQYTGTLSDISDRRLKEDIRPLNKHHNMLDKLAEIDGYQFYMKDDPDKRLEYGVVAQELEEVFPTLVRTGKDEMGTKSVNYIGLIGPMIEGINDLHDRQNKLEEELASLQSPRHSAQNWVWLLAGVLIGLIGSMLNNQKAEKKKPVSTTPKKAASTAKKPKK